MKTIRLDGEIGFNILAADIANEIKGQNEIELIINSGGGDVTEGFSIYNLLNDFKGRIVAKIDLAGSMASVIAMAADEIVMQSNSSLFMIHRPWGLAMGNSEDFRRTADTLDKMDDMLLDIYEARTKTDREEIKQMMIDETWLNPEESVALGFADIVQSGKADLMMVAMAGMRAQEKVDFSTSKFLAKIESMQANKPSKKNIFDSCQTITDVEVTMRNEFNLSRSESQAICNAVKKYVRGDLEQQQELKAIENVIAKYKI